MKALSFSYFVLITANGFVSLFIGPYKSPSLSQLGSISIEGTFLKGGRCKGHMLICGGTLKDTEMLNLLEKTCVISKAAAVMADKD